MRAVGVVAVDHVDIRARHVAHLRDAVVQKIGRQRAARARVDLHALIERVAHALRDAALELAGDGQAVDGRTDVRDLDDVHEADGVELLVVFRLDKADGERIRAGRGLVGARADGHAALGVEQDLARGVLKAQLKLLAAADIVAVVLFLDRAAVVFSRFRRSVRCDRSLTHRRAGVSYPLFRPRAYSFPRGRNGPRGPFFWYGQQDTIYFAQNQTFKLRLIHSTFVHYVSKLLSTLFPTLERGVPPRLSPHQKSTGQPSLPRALFPFCAKNGPLRYQRSALRLFTFQ